MKRKQKPVLKQGGGQSGEAPAAPKENWALKVIRTVNAGGKPPRSPEAVARLGDELARLRAEGEIL